MIVPVSPVPHAGTSSFYTRCRAELPHARRVAAVMATLLASWALSAAPAAAAAVFPEGWEGGMPGWTATDTSVTPDANDPSWQILASPQTLAVAPGINPALVTLPDAGSLPAAHGGTHAAWFGDSTGTFCGTDWATFDGTPNQTDAKNGCASREAFSGTLTSPTFSLQGVSSATLHFYAWWEIESVNADAYDLMKVEYTTDGAEWTSTTLNPASNPAGTHDQSYSNDGLGVSPSWHEYLVDLTPAVGSTIVQVRFAFDTGDALYQGFRGWLIDDISLSTPADAGTPAISSVTACSGTQNAPVTFVNGTAFLQGSQAIVDGQSVAAGVVSSQRIEIAALEPGNHTVQIQSPNNGPVSNIVQATAGNCTPVTPPPASVPPSTPPVTTPPPPVTTPPPAVAPAITGLQVLPPKFKAAPTGLSITNTTTKAGAKIRYTVSLPSSTTFAVQRVVAGVRKGKSCIARPKHYQGKKLKPCQNLVTVGSFSHTDKTAGAVSFWFTGRIAGHKLSPGNYSLVAIGNAATGKSKPATAAFRIMQH
jgi:hypothetical protein